MLSEESIRNLRRFLFRETDLNQLSGYEVSKFLIHSSESIRNDEIPIRGNHWKLIEINLLTNLGDNIVEGAQHLGR